jgi:hypothetical protein
MNLHQLTPLDLRVEAARPQPARPDAMARTRKRAPLLRPQDAYLSSFSLPVLPSASRENPLPRETVFRASDMSLHGHSRMVDVDMPQESTASAVPGKRRAPDAGATMRTGKRARLAPVSPDEDGTRAAPAHSAMTGLAHPGMPIAAAPGASTDTAPTAPRPLRRDDASSHAFRQVPRILPSPAASRPSAEAGLPDEFRHQLSDLLYRGISVAEVGEESVMLAMPAVAPRYGIKISTKKLMRARSPAAFTGTVLNQLLHDRCLWPAEYLVRHGAGFAAHHAGDAALVRSAALENCPRLLEALIHLGADILAPDPDGKFLLHDAVRAGLAEVTGLLSVPAGVDRLDDNGDTPLLLAVREGKGLDVCAALLRSGADPDCRDRNGHTALTHAVLRDDGELVAALLRANADPDLADDAGNAPLHLACARGNAQIALLLLARGCSTRQTDAHGRIALNLAIECGMEQEAYDLLRYFTPVEARQ